MSYVYNPNFNTYGYKRVSLQEYLENALVNKIPLSIGDALFKFIEDKDKKKKLIRKWKYFAENNVSFKDEYIKKGDNLEIIHFGVTIYKKLIM